MQSGWRLGLYERDGGGPACRREHSEGAKMKLGLRPPWPSWLRHLTKPRGFLYPRPGFPITRLPSLALSRPGTTSPTSSIGGNPLQCSCLEKPRDREPGGLPSPRGEALFRFARPSRVPRGPATSTGSLASQRHPGKFPKVPGRRRGKRGFPAATRERPRESFFNASRGLIPLP